MSEKLITFLRKLRLRYRLWRHERRMSKNNSWKIDIATLVVISRLNDAWLLRNYTPAQGARIDLATGILNAEQALQFLSETIALVSSNGYIPDNIAGTPYQRRQLTLDDLLVDSKNRSIRPMEFQNEVSRLLGELKGALDKLDGDTWPTYYRRKLAGFLTDLFAVEEALLKAALSA